MATKNVKISEKHHSMLKSYCEENGFKMYKMIEKWIDNNCKPKRKDLYGD